MSTGKQSWTTGFYWIGAAMTMACFALVLTGNSELVWRFEHRGFPLSWAVAGAAVVAFLVAEFCHSPISLPDGVENRSSNPVPEWEVAES
jgi:hypothetical protein